MSDARRQPTDKRLSKFALSALILGAGGVARVDVRSRSRLGRIDRSVTAKRIRAFLVALQENAGEIKQ